MKKCFTTIIDWIEAEEWFKFIPLTIAILLIPGFVFIYGTYKGNDLTELGVNPQAAAADPPKILDLRPKLGETIHNKYPRITAQYENKSNYKIRLMVNGEDVTDKLDYISDNRLEYEIRDKNIPANHEVRLSFLDENGSERVAQTTRFKTVIYDDFSAGNINWKNIDNTGSWVFKNNYLEGTSLHGEPSVIEYHQPVQGNIGLQFDAKTMPGHAGGIGAFINSYYRVIIGDNDNETVRIYRDKQVLETYKLQSPLLTDNIYSVTIEWILNPSKIQNRAEEAVIKVYIDGRLVAHTVDRAPLYHHNPVLGLEVHNSKVQINKFMVYCPDNL